MSNVKTVKIIRHFIYGFDMRDGEFINLTYDHGKSDHPGNWGNYIENAKCYDSYQEAWNRMQSIYKELRNGDSANLAGLSLGIIVTCETKEFRVKTAQDRLDEIESMFNKSKRN